MNLFNDDRVLNLISNDGAVNYYGKLMSPQLTKLYFDILLDTIEWKNDEVVIFGKHIITKRKVAWYGDEKYSYTYSNITKQALPWTKELLELKILSEKITGACFNSCLLNLYHSGEEGMTWHSDDEKTLLKNGTIASLSFGAERKFSFKHKHTKQKIEIMLEAGSLLVMKDSTQANWWHRLPPSTKVKTARINLTFRTMVEKGLGV